MNTSNGVKKYLAEALGTFALALIVCLSLKASLPLTTPVLAGLTLGLFAYSTGHISGAHLNPAVTFGAWVIGKIKYPDAISYWVAQFIGAGLAMWLVNSVVGTLPQLNATNTLTIGLAEALGALFFGFGIASAVYGKTPADATGLVVGGSLLFGILVASGMGSLGVINPAVALAIGAFNLMYILGPIVGVTAGMSIYKYLMAKEA